MISITTRAFFFLFSRTFCSSTSLYIRILKSSSLPRGNRGQGNPARSPLLESSSQPKLPFNFFSNPGLYISVMVDYTRPSLSLMLIRYTSYEYAHDFTLFIYSLCMSSFSGVRFYRCISFYFFFFLILTTFLTTLYLLTRIFFAFLIRQWSSLLFFFFERFSYPLPLWSSHSSLISKFSEIR